MGHDLQAQDDEAPVRMLATAATATTSRFWDADRLVAKIPSKEPSSADPTEGIASAHSPTLPSG
jgi:hypothetical protein